MKKRFALVVAGVAAAVLGGCAAGPEKSAAGPGSGPLRETVREEAASLTVTASLKTHRQGTHLRKDVHGTPEYLLVLDVDGQSRPIQGVLQAEDRQGADLRHPEAGTGVRYRFSTSIGLTPGSHRIRVAAPADDISVEREVTLVPGENLLVLEPVYRTARIAQPPGRYGATGFAEGLAGFRMLLNGKVM
jgi:hypothetical protein